MYGNEAKKIKEESIDIRKKGNEGKCFVDIEEDVKEVDKKGKDERSR